MKQHMIETRSTVIKVIDEFQTDRYISLQVLGHPIYFSVSDRRAAALAVNYRRAKHG